MKDVNLDERERTIKKLIDANKQLRSDLAREIDRYTLLEDKYKQIVVRLNEVSKENARNEELVFGMSTGGNMSKYYEYLADQKKH